MAKTKRNPMDSSSSRITDVCGAQTRSGQTCRRRPARGRNRCHMHGGARGSGAPKGDRNGSYVDGAYTAEARAEQRWATSLALREIGNAGKIPPVAANVRQLEGSCTRVVEAPDGNTQAWLQQLHEVLGTASPAFVQASLNRLMAACKLPQQVVPTTTSVSSALALIQSLQPENEIQAALAVDVACLHAASASVLSRLPMSGERRIVSLAGAVSRLERAFHSSVETFYKVKRGNRQVIRVEKIEIQSGAQAIVGSVKHQ